MLTGHSYYFITHWRIPGACGEVADILSDPLALPRWWPSVYLDVVELQPPDANGLNRRVRLRTKGFLPYTLGWNFTVVESRYPHRYAIVADGDFEGRGVWTIEQDGPFVVVTYDWRVAARKPLLRNLSFLLRPIFEANHRWAMAQGQTSLMLELARRRVTSETARAKIPPPPGPVTYAGIALVTGAAVVAGALTYLIVRSRRRKR